MRSMLNRSQIAIATAIIFTFALTLIFLGASPLRRAHAQQTPRVAKVAPQAMKPQQLFAGFWRVDQGFQSTLRIKNVLIAEKLSVSPVVFMADGTEYDLPALELPPNGTANLSVNDALGSAPPSVQAHVSDFGSLLLRFTARSALNAAAALQELNEAQSLIFTTSSKPLTLPGLSNGEQVLDSVWWKRDPGVTAFLPIANTSDAPKELKLEVFGSAGAVRATTLSLNAKNTQMIDLEPILQELPQNESATGGVRISYTGLPADVLPNIHLVNAREGYSASGEFHMYHAMGSAPTSQFSIGSVGLMVGAQDPMMGFPGDARFSVYAVMRNAGEHPLTVKPVLFLMEGAKPRKVELPAEHFAPGEARQLSLARTLSNFNGMATLTFTHDGHPGDLLVATGSVDQTGTYVFEVIPDGLDRSWAKTMPFWSRSGGGDSMITVFNPADSPADFAFSLTYAGGSGRYSIPLHLAPGETRMLDVGQLVEMQRPDPNGNVMPPDAIEGSAQIASMQGVAQWIRVGVSAGIFNVQTATCGGGCKICATATGASIDPNPIPTPQGGSYQATGTVYLSDGSSANETTSPGASWSSANASVATVSQGLVNGVTVGSTTISAVLPAPSDPQPICPTTCAADSTIYAGAPANVTPTVTIDSFNPNPIPTGGTASVGITVNPSATIDLAITPASGGTGTATFGTGGNTTLQITQSTTVTITAGNQSSNGAADLTLTASYQGTPLASMNFSVTSGACTASYSGSAGGGQKNCPAAVSLNDSYNVIQYCPTCGVTCLPINYDGTFTPDQCSGRFGSVQGSGNATVTVTQPGTFAATDCGPHSLNIQTTITSVQGVRTRYIGQNFVLQCNKYPNGNPCP